MPATTDDETLATNLREAAEGALARGDRARALELLDDAHAVLGGPLFETDA